MGLLELEVLQGRCPSSAFFFTFSQVDSTESTLTQQCSTLTQLRVVTCHIWGKTCRQAKARVKQPPPSSANSQQLFGSTTPLALHCRAKCEPVSSPPRCSCSCSRAERRTELLWRKNAMAALQRLCHIIKRLPMSDSFGGPIFSCFCVVVPQGQNYILQRFGRYVDKLEAGCHFVTPCIEEIAYVRGLREDQAAVTARALSNLSQFYILICPSNPRFQSSTRSRKTTCKLELTARFSSKSQTSKEAATTWTSP